MLSAAAEELSLPPQEAREKAIAAASAAAVSLFERELIIISPFGISTAAHTVMSAAEKSEVNAAVSAGASVGYEGDKILLGYGLREEEAL